MNRCAVEQVQAPPFAQDGYQLKDTLTLEARLLAVSYLDRLIRLPGCEQLVLSEVMRKQPLTLPCAVLCIASKERVELIACG